MTLSDIVDHTVKCQPAVVDCFLDGRMLFEHIERLVDVEFGNADGARIIVRQLVELGFVLSAESRHSGRLN